MRIYWPADGGGGMWLGPAFLGFLLIGIGLVLVVWPQVLAYVVAGVFIAAGAGLLGSAWRMRREVTYRPADRQWYVRRDDSGEL